MDQRTRKLMTMFKGLRPRDDSDIVCDKKKKKKFEDLKAFKIVSIKRLNTT